MPDITNPQAIKFVNDQVRPLCEEARAIKARIQAMQATWTGGVNAMIPNTADKLVDGRAAEGVSQLTGADIFAAANELIEIATNLADPIVAKPCVRPLTAE